MSVMSRLHTELCEYVEAGLALAQQMHDKADALPVGMSERGMLRHAADEIEGVLSPLVEALDFAH